MHRHRGSSALQHYNSASKQGQTVIMRNLQRNFQVKQQGVTTIYCSCVVVKCEQKPLKCNKMTILYTNGCNVTSAVVLQNALLNNSIRILKGAQLLQINSLKRVMSRKPKGKSKKFDFRKAKGKRDIILIAS